MNLGKNNNEKAKGSKIGFFFLWLKQTVFERGRQTFCHTPGDP